MEDITNNDKPLGYWLRTVDALITREFARALEGDGIDRRDWMLLNVLDGSVDAPPLVARAQRGGKRVRGLAERGWATEEDGRWTLTDEGRAAKERLGAVVTGIRERVAGAVSPEDFATTLATLEAIGRELGGNDLDAIGPRGFGRRGFGRGHRVHGFGPHGHGFGAHGHGHGHGHPHRPGHEHAAESAYERGFDAGYTRGAAER